MANQIVIKNIYQRMAEVQKRVLSVQKNETVKMHENDKGYKAVTHDDVAAALHLPLAECGVFMLPDVIDFHVAEFEKINQWGKTVTWYRTDIQILVKWINIDDPQDFISSKGAAFALDTSDKSFSKAYSLALKIVLLKVHLLESRDGEEQRPFDDANGGNDAGKGSSKPKEKTPQDPHDVIMPFGTAKGKRLGDLDRKTLQSASDWLKAQMAKDPKPQNYKQIEFIYSKVKQVLASMPPPPNDEPDNFPQDFHPDDVKETVLSPQPSNDAPKHHKAPDDEVIPCDIPRLTGAKGKRIKDLTEGDMRAAILSIDDALKQIPPVANMSQLFLVRNQIRAFLKSVGIE